MSGHVLNIITQVSCTVTQSSWRVAQHILSWWQNPPRRMKRNTILFLFIYRLVSRANSILMSDPANKGCVFQTRKRLYNHKCLLGKPSKQAEKLKSREMKEGWMKNDEGWKMKDDDFKLLKGFALWQTNGRTDICNCRVAFATEKLYMKNQTQKNRLRPCIGQGRVGGRVFKDGKCPVKCAWCWLLVAW